MADPKHQASYLKRMYRRFLRGQQDKKKPPPPFGAATAAVTQTPKGTVVKKEPPSPSPSKRKEEPKQKVEKAKRIEEEEAEEFEQVEGARPALCVRKREAKLRWKKDDDDSGMSGKNEGVNESGSADSPPSPSSACPLNVEPLKDALAVVTLEKQQLRETVERLRLRVGRRNKKIEKLQKELQLKRNPTPGSAGTSPAETPPVVREIKQEIETARAQLRQQNQEQAKKKDEIERLITVAKKNTTYPPGELPPEQRSHPAAPLPAEKSTGLKGKDKKDNDDEPMDEATLSTAQRILAVMKRNQLLETALPPGKNALLERYFCAPVGAQKPPSEEMFLLVDRAISNGVEILVGRPHELDDPVDNQMRDLLIQDKKVKAVLFEVMLLHPSYMPLVWGGGSSLVDGAAGRAPQSSKDKEKQKPQQNFLKSYYMAPPKK